MSERSRFEAEELRGLAARYGGRRVVVEPATKHHPAVMAYQFPALCWCCPCWQRVRLETTDDQSARCAFGCLPASPVGNLSASCPTGKPGHAGYRDVPEPRDGQPHTAYVYDHRENRNFKIARCSCGWESTPSVGWQQPKADLDHHVGATEGSSHDPA